MTFIDQHCAVLTGGNALLIDGLGDCAHQTTRQACTSSGLLNTMQTQLVQAPAMKMSNDDTPDQILINQQLRQLGGQRVVVTQHQYRLVSAPRQLCTTISKNHGLARTRHAMHYAMPIAQTARQLLLLQIHDVQRTGEIITRSVITDEQ